MGLFQRFERNELLVQLTQDIPVSSATDDSFIKLIVGLGNVGKEYTGTRHNIGFSVVDSLQKEHSFPAWKDQKKFKALVTEEYVGGRKIILAKPTTFMNASGEAVRALKDFYKLTNKDIIVVHDELDLPFETVKLKVGGGSAGNNGLKSLIAHIGEDFTRIRVGIKNDLLEKMDAADFVLGKFSKAEQAEITVIVEAATELLNI